MLCCLPQDLFERSLPQEEPGPGDEDTETSGTLTWTTFLLDEVTRVECAILSCRSILAPTPSHRPTTRHVRICTIVALFAWLYKEDFINHVSNVMLSSPDVSVVLKHAGLRAAQHYRIPRISEVGEYICMYDIDRCCSSLWLAGCSDYDAIGAVPR